MQMGPRLCLTALIINLVPMAAFADHTQWQKFVIPSTGAKVDIPVSIFTEDAGAPEGATGRRFFTSDRRADLTLQSVPNPRLTRHFSYKAAASHWHSVQTGDAPFLRSV